MNLALISFNDIDITTGLVQLIQKYGSDTKLLVPIIHDTEKFYGSIIKVCKEKEVSLSFVFASADGLDHLLKNADDLVVADNPVKEVLRNLTPDDALAVVFDDSAQAHFAVHAVEDLGIDIWDVTSGITRIEIDIDDDEEDFMNMSTGELRESVHDAVINMVDVMAAYIAGLVMDALSQGMLESALKKDISRLLDQDDQD